MPVGGYMKGSIPFTELSIKSDYTFELANRIPDLELFEGVKNLTNAYRNDFDTGKNRDNNDVYGPAAPRTFFVGVQVNSL